jgi:hypothetical protein
VERAARSSRRQAACAGLLAACLGACAAMQEPPGGPLDFDAPIILAITPDSGAVAEGFDDAVEIEFNEVLDERSVENLILLSPRPEELNVSWKRSRITVQPKGGWRENVIYHLTLLPGFADLRNNRLDSGKTVVFSTGGEIPNTSISGTIIDWESGQSAPRALIEAVLLPDSLVYTASADSIGDFEISLLPPGSYLIVATVDQNNNRLRDPREFYDSAFVQLDSTISQVLWTVAHDTVGLRISEISDLDSVTIKIDFGQKLAPGEPPDDAVTVYALPDTTLVDVVSIWNQVVYDSVHLVEAAEDSVRRAAAAEAAAQAAADSAAVADTLGGAEIADTAEVEPAAVADSIIGELVVVEDSAQIANDSAAADTSHITMLLSERPELSASWYVRLASSMIPGARYFLMAVAENLSGAIAESQGLLILPEPVDTTLVPADTT